MGKNYASRKSFWAFYRVAILKKGEINMTVIEELKAEHQAVLLTIRILDQITSKLENGQAVDSRHLDQILEFFQVFVDKCHHFKEEKVLFPAMVQAGIQQEFGPISVMLYEHARGRSLVQGMKIGVEAYRVHRADAIAQITENAEKYGRLLVKHINKENKVLYVMAERVLSPEKMVEIAKAFVRVNQLEIGPDKHEEFYATLHALKDIYLA